jgi:hypothetical protein
MYIAIAIIMELIYIFSIFQYIKDELSREFFYPIIIWGTITNVLTLIIYFKYFL